MPLTSVSSDAFFTVDPEDIISFDLSLRLRSAPTGTVVLSNRDDKYTPHVSNYLSEIFRVTVTYDKTDYDIFVGVIKNVNIRKEGRDGSSVVEFTLSPIVESLANRPIETEEFTAKTGTLLLTDLLYNYGSLDTAYFDVTEDDAETFSSIIVGSDSLLDAVRQVAEACNVEIYVDNTGKLVTGAKKDIDSAVGATLTTQDIASFASNDSEVHLMGVVQVTGRYLSAREDGNKQVVDQDISNVMGQSQDRLIIRYTPKQTLTNEQVLGLVVSVVSGADNVEVIGRDPESGDIILRAWKKGGFDVGEQNSIELEIYTPVLDTKELDKSLAQWQGGGEGENTNLGVDLNGAVRSVTGKSTNYKRRKNKRQSNQRKNELAAFRVNATVVEEETVATLNYRVDTIDNLYIQDEAKAIEIGKRALYEDRMRATSFSVVGPFLPTINNVNMVVNVEEPYTSPQVTHTCLVAGLTFSWSASRGSLMTTYDFILLPPHLESSSS